jgi:putative endonuclease
MAASNKTIGKQGEELAVDFLKKHHYHIIQQNYRCPFGEIDIIARKKNVLVFVEVKTRRSSSCGLPQEAIHERKQRTIAQVALAFMQHYRLEGIPARFDVVAVHLTQHGQHLELIENAFELPF